MSLSLPHHQLLFLLLSLVNLYHQTSTAAQHGLMGYWKTTSISVEVSLSCLKIPTHKLDVKASQQSKQVHTDLSERVNQPVTVKLTYLSAKAHRDKNPKVEAQLWQTFPTFSLFQVSLVIVSLVYYVHYVYHPTMVMEVAEQLRRNHREHIDVSTLANSEQVRS